jgi:predicted MPP superfamily phosphohydrolase
MTDPPAIRGRRAVRGAAVGEGLRALRRRTTRSSVALPFRDPAGGKGPFAAITRAGRHRIAEYRVALAGWPADAPLRIALLSDHHIGSHAGDVARHQALCAEANGLGADLILLLGDYMNMMPFFGGRVPPDTVAAILGRLAAPLGVHAVLGNHDWEYGGAAVADALAGAGIAIHENAGRRLVHRGHAVYLAGLADHEWRRPDLGAALAAAPPGDPVIVMSHNPAGFAAVPARTCLMVAGHTHGGQWVVPGLGPLWIPGPAPLAWAHGLIEEDGRVLIVSAGLGTSGLPWRINRPPEIVVVTIAAPAVQPIPPGGAATQG